jgi:hypothetical protein
MGMLRATWRRVFCGVLVAALVFGNIMLTTSTASAAGGISGSVSGTVVDDSKNPVPGAAITIASPSGTYHGRSDEHGAFSVLGVLADTYVITITKTGYAPATLSGITITGDNALSLGNITLGRQVIGKTRARAANSAYQPNQTIDSTTLSGARVQQALGSPVNTNETQLILAAPGTALSSSGNITIRGSLSTEIGYQYDGVNFTQPFFDANGSNGYIINLTGGVGGSLQVVSGSGDATQGNVGAGVINIVPPRGTYPATGDLATNVAGPNYKHQLDADYAIASANGRVSDYFSYDGQRYVPQNYPFGVDASTIGEFAGTSFVKHDDLQNNFVYRFGKDNDQSIQVLFRVSDDQQLGNYGGLENAQYYFYNPLASANFTNNLVFGTPSLTETPANSGQPGSFLGYGSFQNAYTSLFQLLPGIPSTSTVNPSQPEEIGYQPLHFIKVGYTKNFGSSTFLNADYYDWGVVQGSTDYTGGGGPDAQEIGGTRVGFDVNLTHQFGSNHTVTLATKYENADPRWNLEAPVDSAFGLSLGEYYQLIGQEAPGFTYWALPTTPGAAISATNKCSYNLFGSADPCYIYNYLQSHGLYTGIASMPQIPTFGIDYHGSDFQSWGVGIRDQWTVSSKLKIDYGLREDGAQYKFGPNTYAYDPYGNPSDLSNNLLSPQFLEPRILQPRFAASYQITPNDSVRASYGRSTEFAFAQTAGTPMGIFNVNPILNSIPATDSAAAPACGSGYHAAGGAYSPNPNIPFSGSAITGSSVGNYFKCTSLAQQIFWLYDQQLDAPDYGGSAQEGFSNYDLAYSHQFTSGVLAGWGTKLTGFARRGFNIYEDVLLTEGPPNPLTGQSSGSVFSVRPDGEEKTSGLEFQLTTPDRPVGFSGFASATYIAAFGSNPPVANGGNYASDNLPGLVTTPVLLTGTLFRQIYVAPFQARTGITYKTKGGLSVTPILSGTTGYPFGVGTSTVGTDNGTLGFIPTSNFGQATPIAGPVGPNKAYNAPSYVDPAYPGSYLNPTIAATRGYAEPSLAGNKLGNPTTNADINIEQAIGKRLSFGVYLSNLWNVHDGIAYQNTKWQPVATGVGGPQTGQNDVNANPASAFYGNYVAGGRDQYAGAGGYTPFSFVYQQGRTINVYLQAKL